MKIAGKGKAFAFALVFAGMGIAFLSAMLCFSAAASCAAQPRSTHDSTNGIVLFPSSIEGNKNKDIDVVFIGDSEAYSAFSPLHMWKEQGVTSYVCAGPAQPLPYGNTLLKRTFADTKPSIVVFETCFIFTPFTHEDAKRRELEDGIPVIALIEHLKNFGIKDPASLIRGPWDDDLKGYLPSEKSEAADTSDYMKPSKKVEQIPDINKEYVGKMIESCRANGAVPVLVTTPSTVYWNMPRHNAIAELAKEYGVDYYDFNVAPTKLDMDWKVDSRDKGKHLNLYGAAKVSSELSGILKKQYGLPDHRDDPSYSAWNALLDRYAYFWKETKSMRAAFVARSGGASARYGGRHL